MLIHFDFTSGVPLYRQLRDQIVLGPVSYTHLDVYKRQGQGVR